MDNATHQQWLADTRRFWDADSEFDARYRRICSSPDFDATTDETTLQHLWNAETDRAVRMILKNIPIRSDWTCLEIGAGIGRLLKPIAAQCHRAIGVDISPKMVNWSAKHLADTPNAHVQLNDGCSLTGIGDESVDFVYAHLAFQHFTLPEVVDDYLSEIQRVLKVGGYCRIQNWREERRPLAEAVKDVVRPIFGKRRYVSERSWRWSQGRDVQFGGISYRPRVWRRQLSQHGLHPIATELGEGHDFWMWTTCRRVTEP